jgi:hypothetical protein
MLGLELSSLTGELHKVSLKYNKKPVGSIKDVDTKIGPWREFWTRRGFTDRTFLSHYYELPLKALKGFSFDEICKLRHSSSYTMELDVEKLFETDANYEVVNKIMSSMWRWGTSRGMWNEIVVAYDCIRHFSFLNNPNFEVSLDHTKYFNPYGYAKYSRVFIDGVFALLVYYKKEHVLTVGFSITAGKGLLIQQVQMSKRTGNRWLYHFPSNRLEFVISLFRSNFPGYQIAVIDGSSLVNKTLSDYQQGLDRAQEHCKNYREVLAKNRSESKEYYVHALKESKQDCAELSAKIAHLESDAQRLVAFYENAGSFVLGPESKKFNGLLHHKVAS